MKISIRNRVNKDLPYNPKIHNRRSIRLKGYEYSQAGAYFITICCEDRKYRFGNIKNGEMILNEFGSIAYNEWVELQNRFPNFELDIFQIMPNHMHGIIILNNSSPVRTGFTPVPPNQNKDLPAPTASDKTNCIKNANKDKKSNPVENEEIINDDSQDLNYKSLKENFQGNRERATARVAPTVAPTLGGIIGAYKSLVSKKCLEIYNLKDQRMGKIWQRTYWEHIIRDERAYNNISAYILNNPKKWQEDKFYKV